MRKYVNAMLLIERQRFYLENYINRLFVSVTSAVSKQSYKKVYFKMFNVLFSRGSTPVAIILGFLHHKYGTKVCDWALGTVQG